jgi:hypothetical protein
MSELADGTYWVELGFLPAEVGYVLDAKVWKATLAKLGTEDRPFPDTDGNCTTFEDIGLDRKLIVLITVGKRAKDYSVSQVCGIIAHECMHAWRFIKKAIGERRPSLEFEAYAMQAMTQGVVYAHMTKRKRPWAPIQPPSKTGEPR